jgi:hypothetical protein
MEGKKPNIIGGIVLISIGIALFINVVTTGNYYGPIILLGVGLALILKNSMKEGEKRGAPVGGIFLVILGIASLIDALTGSMIIISAIKGITPFAIPIILVLIGARLLFR